MALRGYPYTGQANAPMPYIGSSPCVNESVPSPRTPAFEEEVWARVKRINEMVANLEHQARVNWEAVANIRACCFGQEPEPADGNEFPSEVQPQSTGFCGELVRALHHIEHNANYLMLILNMAYTEGERLRGLLFDPERKA